MKQLPDVAAFYMEREYNISGVTVQTFELRDEYSNGRNDNYPASEDIRYCLYRIGRSECKAGSHR